MTLLECIIVGIIAVSLMLAAFFAGDYRGRITKENELLTKENAAMRETIRAEISISNTLQKGPKQ